MAKALLATSRRSQTQSANGHKIPPKPPRLNSDDYLLQIVQQRSHRRRITKIRPEGLVDPSPAASDLQKRIESGKLTPFHVFQERKAAKTLDTKTVVLCVHEQRKVLREAPFRDRSLVWPTLEKVGGPVLDWLWQRDEQWVPMFAQSRFAQFQFDLCFILAVERPDEYVSTLLSTPLPQHVV